MIPVQRVEPAEFTRAAPEQLHEPDPAYPLLHERVDPREPTANFAVCIAHLQAEQPAHPEDERDHRERREREPPVGDEHHRADRREREQVAQSRHHPRREQLVERLDVPRHPRHQAPHRGSVEVRDRQPLQVREQLGAQVLHHALSE